MVINEKYYDGFEGEPEIIFCLFINDILVEKLGFWDGYFNEIMSLIIPEERGWTGLAYYYYLYIGWYEEENWMIPDLKEAYVQFIGIDSSRLGGKEDRAVLHLILEMIKKAIDSGGKVSITYN